MQTNNRNYLSTFVVGLVALLCFASLPFLQQSPPLGPIPPFEESNRIHHPSGFSIICPENWESEVLDSSNKITLNSPHRVRHARSPATYLQVMELSSPPDISALRVAEGFEADARMEIEHSSGRPGLHDHVPPSTSIRLFRKLQGRWFVLMYSTPQHLDIISNDIMDLLATFDVAAG